MATRLPIKEGAQLVQLRGREKPSHFRLGPRSSASLALFFSRELAFALDLQNRSKKHLRVITYR